MEHTPSSSNPTTANRLPSPLAIVRQRVMRRDSPFTPAQRLVALEIAARLNRETRSWAIPYEVLVEATGLSMRTVGACVRVLCDGDEPVFARRAWGRKATHPTRRRIWEFRVVENIVVFAARRAAENSEHERQVRAEHEGFVAEQKRGAAREWANGNMSDAEYQQANEGAVVELERRVKRAKYAPRRRRRADSTGD